MSSLSRINLILLEFVFIVCYHINMNPVRSFFKTYSNLLDDIADVVKTFFSHHSLTASNSLNIGKITIFIFVFLLSCSWSEASTYFPVYKADFWIQRLANPDEPILTSAQIEEFNESILDENDQMADIVGLENTVSKENLIEWLLKDPIPQDKKVFDKKGRAVEEAFFKELLNNMNIEEVKETNDLIFGVVVKRTDIRAFPTEESVSKSPSARDFDAFQYSSLYPPQPVALLHKSKDGRWGFFQTPFVRGWIKIDDIGFADTRNDINPKSETPNSKSLVITGSMVKVFKSKKNKTAAATVPMGTVLTVQGEDKNYWIVKFPEKDKQGRLRWIDTYIEKRADIHMGPLAYNRRNVIRQAFKLLGERYGWGGINGLRDCSSFIKDVFATMGINLPRHSSHQAAVGKVLINIDETSAHGDIKKAMDSAIPGITLFGLNGHIMLYLGNINGSYYTLHQFFGYHDKDGFRTVNKAMVTNLELGKESKMGPLRERIKSVNLVVQDGVN